MDQGNETAHGLKRLPAAFFRQTNGREPVRDWLKSLSPEDRKIIGDDIRTLEFGWPIGMPLARPLGNGLWEVRSTIAGRRIARVIFCVHDQHAVLLHGFIKKTQQTPKADMDLALRRKMEIER
jgi:phage-related protein